MRLMQVVKGSNGYGVDGSITSKECSSKSYAVMLDLFLSALNKSSRFQHEKEMENEGSMVQYPLNPVPRTRSPDPTNSQSPTPFD